MIHGSMVERLAEILGPRIVAGDLPAPATIDTFVDEYSVSRTVAREAVNSLVAKGMLVTRPGQGLHIADRAAWLLTDADVLRWLLPYSPELSAQAKELAVVLDEHGSALALSFLAVIDKAAA